MPTPLDVQRPSETELHLARSFTAPADRVYEAHLDPTSLRVWLGVRLPLGTCEVDARVGGSFRYVWSHPEAGEMGMRGTFLELVPGARIVHTEVFDEDWTGGPVQVTTDFLPHGAGSRLELHLRYSSAEALEGALATGMLEGMAESCQALEELLVDSGPIVISASVAATTGEAWAAFTEPERITTWNFATEDWSCPKATSDLRPGGTFSYRMAARDGSMAFDYHGTWEVVEPPRRLVQRLGDGRRVEITFAEVEGGTRVTETFDPDDGAPRELQRAGWQSILDRFAATAGR